MTIPNTSPNPISVEIIGEYLLKVTFVNNEIKVYNARKLLSYAPYKKMRDISYFNTVKVSEDGMTLEWEDGNDICPDELYESSMPFNG